MRELECPACGALIEDETDEQLVRSAQLHTIDAHSYVVPAEHVLKVARDVP
jgi:hypothetical protein